MTFYTKGGKYYYWEHILETEWKFVRMIQHLFSYTFYDIVFGCQLNRKSDEIIKSFNGFSKVEQERFRTPLLSGLYHAFFIIHNAHVRGVATK